MPNIQHTIKQGDTFIKLSSETRTSTGEYAEKGAGTVQYDRTNFEPRKEISGNSSGRRCKWHQVNWCGVACPEISSGVVEGVWNENELATRIKPDLLRNRKYGWDILSVIFNQHYYFSGKKRGLSWRSSQWMRLYYVVCASQMIPFITCTERFVIVLHGDAYLAMYIKQLFLII